MMSKDKIVTEKMVGKTNVHEPTTTIIYFPPLNQKHFLKAPNTHNNKKKKNKNRAISICITTMESALFSSPSRCFLVSTSSYDKSNFRALGRNFQASFSGKMHYNNDKNNFNSPFTRNIRTSSLTTRAIFSSRLGKKVKKETIIPDPDYRIPVVLLGMAGGCVYVDNLAAAAPLGLLGLLLLVQTTRVRFVFDEEALEVRVGDELQESGENAFVGGKNRWKYSSFVNWELWWPAFPILVYFKETQTKPEGQIHFFPVIFNGKQLYDVMVERCGPSKTSGPK